MDDRADNTSPPATQAEHYDPAASKLGMWLFLFSEALLFGTMFIAYAAYLQKYTWMFRAASHYLSKPIGAANTAVLLTSSLSIALAIAAMARGRRRQAVGLMFLTVALALVFLVIKSFEWGEKFHHGIYPLSDVVLALPPGEQLFLGLYFVMTGLHGLHVIAGAAAILWAVRRIRLGRIRPDQTRVLENVGLYWHLVDVIWIYLFPLFYLIG